LFGGGSNYQRCRLGERVCKNHAKLPESSVEASVQVGDLIAAPAAALPGRYTM